MKCHEFQNRRIPIGVGFVCSAVLASMMISTGSYVASCGGDPVGGGRPCGISQIG